MSKLTKYKTLSLCLVFLNMTYFHYSEADAQEKDVQLVEVLEQQPHIVWPDCIITNAKGKVLKKMAGYLCVPFQDGTYLSTNDKYLRFFSSENKIVNKLQIYPHHQIKTHSDASKILAIGTKYTIYKGKNTRFDVLYEISRDGKILKEFDFGINFPKYLKIANIQNEVNPWHFPEGSRENLELTHVNSFYLIPKNSLTGHEVGFEEGNYIVNDNLLQKIIILDRDLEKIVRIIPYVQDTESIHDVSVDKEGKLLLYNNIPKGYENHESSIDIWNPITLEVVKRYQPKIPQNFYQYKCGGVEQLESGEYMFYDNNFNVTILDENFKFKMSSRLRPFEYQDIIQEIRVGDYSEFLENNVEW